MNIALISEDGSQVFYAERDPLPEEPTDFVRQVVYPLLDRGEVAMPDAVMTTALRKFIAGTREPYVLADYPNDLKLLRHVIAGFDDLGVDAATHGLIPNPVTTLMLKDGLMAMLVEDWFASHPEDAARRHHALIDAQALRMAWLAATRRIQADWARQDYLGPNRNQ
ncbi:3'-5' exoribonuclease [Lysobacter sp. S4-A87]|uniref:3'-5' exoribonuclease n=1 Tax=Lysobacter sp. S4-A87 TaxID=2925843 RepID=UPI001F52E694|nr:3'-5' exoribonuclease [Lysobacter sp. S4-A87]